MLTSSFNQDSTHIALGLRGGWRIFACEPFAPCHAVAESSGIGAISMLFSSSLLALVGCGERAGDSPRRLRLWNTTTSSAVFELTFATAVLNVLMNRTRLLVVLEDATHIFELLTMRMLHTLDTMPNPRAVAALSVEGEASYCAVLPPGINSTGSAEPSAATSSAGKVGTVLIFDGAQGRPLGSIAAHSSPVARVALSPSGDTLATCSEKGTVVRVHACPSGELLHTLRRGSTRATIYSLSFGTTASAAAVVSGAAPGEAPAAASSGARPAAAAQLLCAASSTGTVHVWKLPTEGVAAASGARGVLGMMMGGVGSVTGREVSAERDFAQVRLKRQSANSKCRAALRLGDAPSDPASLYVLTGSGEWFSYRLDSTSGEVSLLDERRLLSS